MNAIRITSSSNQLMKEIRSLQDKKGRQSSKAVLLEGVRLVVDAYGSGAVIRYFIVSDSFLEKAEPILADFSHPKVIQVPDDLFTRIGETRSPQGLMAVADMPVYNPHDIYQDINRVIALENLQDPGNLGTIIRTADACGFDAVILSNDSVDPFNPKVVRSTMGSLFRLPVLVADDIYHSLDELKRKGLRIASAHIKNALPCWQADLSSNIAIVIGNEGNGLTERMLNMSDLTVMIPMAGRTESLNASAAASILLYESMRQNTKLKN